MLSHLRSVALVGIDALPIEIETQIFGSLRKFSIIGLPDGVLKESRERVRCAIENSGFAFPEHEVIVSLAPASLPKSGAGLDLAIALGVLASSGNIPREELAKYLFLGELGLNGEVRAVPGGLAASILALKLKRSSGSDIALVTAIESAPQAALIKEVAVYPVRSLGEAVLFLQKSAAITRSQRIQPAANSPERTGADFGDVMGQHAAKRALEIVAAGGHNMLMLGPPGSGKSMLAGCLPTILPKLSENEAIEVTKIHSAARSVHGDSAAPLNTLLTERPFRSPHHTVSSAGLVGGGSNPSPGEISLAHRGVLFLDELVEFRRDVLEALRQPLENKRIVISRAAIRLTFPADFILVAAMNPCPCGNYGSSGEGTMRKRCSCGSHAVRRYLGRLSGPILDRIDLHVWVPALAPSELRPSTAPECSTTSSAILERVTRTRTVQRDRFRTARKLNAHMSPRDLKSYCALGGTERNYLERSAAKLQLSARGIARTLKLARTIADISGEKGIEATHLSEALSYRFPEEFSFR